MCVCVWGVCMCVCVCGVCVCVCVCVTAVMMHDGMMVRVVYQLYAV